MRTAKTLISLGGCPGWSESSLGAQPHCWFCHEAAHFSLIVHVTHNRHVYLWFIFFSVHFSASDVDKSWSCNCHVSVDCMGSKHPFFLFVFVFVVVFVVSMNSAVWRVYHWAQPSSEWLSFRRFTSKLSWSWCRERAVWTSVSATLTVHISFDACVVWPRKGIPLHVIDYVQCVCILAKRSNQPLTFYQFSSNPKTFYQFSLNAKNNLEFLFTSPNRQICLSTLTFKGLTKLLLLHPGRADEHRYPHF